MKQKRFFVLLFVSLAALSIGAFFASYAAADILSAENAWQEKVDAWVLETAVNDQETEFLVFLAEQADVSGAEHLQTKEEKGQYVFDRLTAVAQRTQTPVIAALEAAGVEYRPFWVANMIWVRGNADVVASMARRADVAHIYANPTVHLDEPEIIDVEAVNSAIETATAVEWNITHVGAPDVWALGYDGTGIVVAGQDTGYDWDHPALKNQYRGWNGAAADHNYNWHDSIHSGGGSCGADSPEPCDDSQHGTHTMGTIVGDDGGTNQIGMAPGARWIGCRNMDQGNGTPATYTECYQWFMAPTQLDGSNPDPSMSPHVINNSWGCPPSEGCTDPNVMLTVVNNVVAAGIITVHSAGNSGSSCESVSDPAAIYDASYTIGATDSSDNIASFSSRGPVTIDGSGRMKPDISAPGVNIRSSVPGGGYAGGWQGTSMAGPHVAGAVALLLQRAPSLIGDSAAVENLLNANALPRTSTQTCGGVPGSSIPNNTFGWGRLDILAAVNNAAADFNIEATPASQNVCIPNNAMFDVVVDALSGITETVTLSASGYPTGTTAVFSVNADVPSFTSTLTISDTAVATPGSYLIDVVGTTASLSHTSTVTLVLDAGAPLSPTLISPANNATGVPTSPTFTWQPAANAASYEIQIATDAAFSNIVDSASGLTTTSYDTAVTLNATTQYYWRVWANNGCGTGAYSAVFTFTTANIVCAIYPGPGGPIADLGSTDFLLDISASGIVDDINVLDLTGTHTWMGDLDFQLASPAATSIQLRAADCGSAHDFDINYDDEAAPGSPPCPPTDGGTYQPDGPGALSDFDGEDISGTWILTINDNAGADTGTLNSWSLEICYAPVNAPIMTVSPDMFTSAQEPDTQITQTMTISNSGDADLSWTLYEDNATNCSAANDIPWLSAAPASGTVISGSAAIVDVTFDSAGMTDGVYNADLCLSSNDPGKPLTTLPVTMTVASPLAPPVLTSPADGAINVSTMPTLTWSSVSGADDYLVEVAADNGFATIIVSATVTTTSYSGFTLNDGTTYYWRVTAHGNSESATSTVYSFTTMVLEKVYLPLIVRP